MADSYSAQLGRINASIPSSQTAQPAVSAGKNASGANFADVLAQTQDVKFSNHAQKRLQTRDIQLSQDNVNRLSDAIDKAGKRGGKSSLVMMDDMAFIVNVPQRLVVTALDAGHRGEGVFTQIDSVVFADPSSGATSTVDRKG
jgi:flagellar operon protein